MKECPLFTKLQFPAYQKAFMQVRSPPCCVIDVASTSTLIRHLGIVGWERLKRLGFLVGSGLVSTELL